MRPATNAIREMVGRERTLAGLVALASSARHGRGRSVLLLGEAGMGKSMLAEALAERAEALGFRLARGWCSAEETPPYWPWRWILRGLPPDGRPPLGGAGATELDRRLLFAAVVESLEEAGRRQPLLLVMEDAQWADQPSLLLLRTVAEAVPAMPVVLLVTCRDEPGEAAPEVRRGLADLPTSVRRLQLVPLDRRAVAELVERVGGSLPPEVVERVCERTGGNPFFVREVVQLLDAQGGAGALVVPPGVREVLERRLARLSQPCHELLAAAAVGGDPIDEPLLAAISGRDETALVELLDEASRARLIAPDPSGLSRSRFAHALVREALEGGLPAPERARLHQRAAEELERGETAGLEHRLAQHWSQATGAGARARAAHWSLLAARAAMAGLGFEQAAADFRRALHGTGIDRLAVLLELGTAERLSGDPGAARATYLAAAAAARAAGRPEQLAEAALGLGGGLAGFEVRVSDERQIELLREADAALPPGDSVLRAAVRGRLSLVLTEIGSLEERVRLAEEAVAMARRTGEPRVEAAVLAAYCDAVAGPDFVEARRASAERMLALAEAAGDRVAALLARRLRLVANLERGDFAAVDAEIDAYRRSATTLGIPLYLWLPAVWTGMRALLAGDPEAALRHAAAAEEIGARAGSDNATVMVLTLRTHAHRVRGTPEAFASDISRSWSAAVPSDRPSYLAGNAWLLLEAGDATEAGAVLRRYLGLGPEEMLKDAEWLEAHWALAQIAIALRHREAAERLFDELAPYQPLWAVDSIGGAVFGTVGHQLGRLAAFLGRRGVAAAYLRGALDRYRAAGASLLAEQVTRELARLAEPGQAAAPAVAAPAAPAEPLAGELHREGALWRLGWRGRSSAVPDSKGMRDLARLLRQPGRPVPAVELVAPAGAPPAGGDLGPALDATARRAYQVRLVELEQAIADAEADADLGKAERLRDERSMLVAQLAGAFGLGGRPRRLGDPAERARKAVTMRIRSALRAVEEVDPALGRHLRNAVRTGRLCVYQPEDPVTWRT